MALRRQVNLAVRVQLGKPPCLYIRAMAGLRRGYGCNSLTVGAAQLCLTRGTPAHLRLASSSSSSSHGCQLPAFFLHEQS